MRKQEDMKEWILYISVFISVNTKVKVKYISTSKCELVNLPFSPTHRAKRWLVICYIQKVCKNLEVTEGWYTVKDGHVKWGISLFFTHKPFKTMRKIKTKTTNTSLLISSKWGSNKDLKFPKWSKSWQSSSKTRSRKQGRPAANHRTLWKDISYPKSLVGCNQNVLPKLFYDFYDFLAVSSKG